MRSKIRIKAIFRIVGYVYRPEMQFTLFDLKVDKINQTDSEGNVVNVIDSTKPVFTSTDQQIDFIYTMLEDELDMLESFGPDRELVLGFGGNEYLLTTHTEEDAPLDKDKVSITSLGNIIDLDPEDYLTMQIYQNGDDENVLWEFAFGKEPEAGPIDGLVFADEPEIEIYANLPGISDEESETPKNVTIKWTVEGDNGSVEEQFQKRTNGIYFNKLQVSNKADDEFYVTAEIHESEDDRYVKGSKTKIGPFTVIPGTPAQIRIDTSETEVPADGVSEVTLTVEVKDKHDNLVPDGTAVTMSIIGDSADDVETEILETTSGKAEITLALGTVVGERKFQFTASEITDEEIKIFTTDIGLEVNTSGTSLIAGSNETIDLFVSTNASDGTPIEWSTTHGNIHGVSQITSGQATATLYASDIPGDSQIYVMVAGEKKIIDIEHAWNGTSVEGKLSYEAIVGDSIADGSISIDHWQGSANYEYKASTEMGLHGTPGESMRVALGTPLTPNAAAVAYFPLQSIIGGAVSSADDAFSAMALGSVSEDSENNALEFDGTCQLMIGDSPELQIDNDLFASLSFIADEFDTSEWPVVGSDLKQGPSLLSQGTGSDIAYRIGLVEFNGQIKVEAVVQTADGIFNVLHNLEIIDGTAYDAALRYKNGYLEVEVDTGSVSVSSIESVAATGLLLNTDESISVGNEFTGLIRTLRIGVESSDRLITKLANGGSAQNVTFNDAGTASVGIASTGRFAGIGQKVGVTHISAENVGQLTPQPVRFAYSGSADWMFSLFKVKEAYADSWNTSSRAKNRGVTVVSTNQAGWFGSLADKLSDLSAHAKNTAKKAGNVLAMLVGIDDFIVLTKAIAALAAGAKKEIDVVEVSFAAVGAILTIIEIISAGTLAPAIHPLKFGLKSFKLAIKAIGPAGIKAAFGMAKGLGKVIADVIKTRGARGAAFDALKYTALALAHLATKVGTDVFNIFTSVVRSAKDFKNWVESFAFFKKACFTAYLPAANTGPFYAGLNAKKLKQLAATAAMSFFVSTAYAASPCEDLFDSSLTTVKAIAEAASVAGDAKDVTRVLGEFNDVCSQLNKYIVNGDKLKDFALTEGSIKGIAVMLSKGRTPANVRTIARAIARTDGLDDAAKIAKINQYFKLIGDLDEYHDAATISGRLYGDMGKLLFNSKTEDFNTGFIKGLFHQLDFLDDLRDAEKSVEALEQGINVGKVQRYVDVVADGRKFELKNFANYYSSNITAVVDGLNKDLVHAMANGASDTMVKESLEKIHFVFRGNPTGAEKMIEKMTEAGLEKLKKGKYPDARKLFEEQMQQAADLISGNVTSKVPVVGQMVVFQGKNVPF